MKRGEVWTVSGGPDYVGKPRPAVIIQDDSFDATSSITICPFTSVLLEAPNSRPVVQPSGSNGLQTASAIMVDKISTVARSRLRQRIGNLDDEEMISLRRSIIIFLGLGERVPSDPR